jgi:predicted RNA binding protein YcfA (HicA-like mRNA interferase family)
MCKVLEARGWVLSRIQSSHHIHLHRDFPGVTLAVPVHGNRDLSTGTQRSLMRRAGLADDDL